MTTTFSAEKPLFAIFLRFLVTPEADFQLHDPARHLLLDLDHVVRPMRHRGHDESDPLEHKVFQTTDDLDLNIGRYVMEVVDDNDPIWTFLELFPTRPLRRHRGALRHFAVSGDAAALVAATLDEPARQLAAYLAGLRVAEAAVHPRFGG